MLPQFTKPPAVRSFGLSQSRRGNSTICAGSIHILEQGKPAIFAQRIWRDIGHHAGNVWPVRSSLVVGDDLPIASHGISFCNGIEHRSGEQTNSVAARKHGQHIAQSLHERRGAVALAAERVVDVVQCCGVHDETFRS
jgi:hypothetical protein